MFDPYREQIIKWCLQGVTCKEMTELLPKGYDYHSLYEYIRTNNLRDHAWERVYGARNHCIECEYCHEYINAKGFVNKAEPNICTKTWRVIPASVVHSPRWCEK